MPFGKYSGLHLKELPSDYLQWLCSLADLREPLLSAVMEEQERRCLPLASHVAGEIAHVATEIINAGYRSLAAKRHPDHGGSHQEMLALNEAKDWLNEQIIQ